MNIELINQNGTDSYIFTDVGNLSGFELSQPRLSIEDVGGDQAAFYVTSKNGKRRLSWQSVIPNSQANVFSVYEALRIGGLKTIKFSACGLDYQTEVEIESFSMPYFDKERRICKVEAVSPDWRFLSQTLNNESFAVGDEVDVVNDGNETSNAIYTITGPADAVGISEIETGFLIKNDGDFILKNDSDKFIVSTVLQSMSLTPSLGVGDTLVIDTKEKTIKINGVDAYSSFSGDFIFLEPGSNNLFFLATGSTGATTLEVDYRDSYIGI